MGKAGGILGILGGIFGLIAAFITLFMGGLGAALDAESGGTVIGLGWGGLLFSILAIVFGAISLSGKKWAGISLTVVSIAGAILGGTLVAICLVIALVGGILAIIGAEKDVQTLGSESEVPQKAKRNWLMWGGVGAVVIILLIAMSSGGGSKKAEDEIAALAIATPSELSPVGELAEIFSFGSKNTDLQRENKIMEITGQVVQWGLPVYEVSRDGDGYKIQTQSNANIFGLSMVSAFVYVTPRSDAERQEIEALQTGNIVKFKGIVAGESMRNLKIKPAILFSEEAGPAEVGQTSASAQESVQPAIEEVSETPEPEVVEEEGPTGPSFDCAKAGTVVEKLICGNGQVSRLDLRLSGAYKDFLSVSEDKAAAKQDQIAWIKGTRNACQTDECLIEAYQTRISDFEASIQYLSKPAEFR